MLDQVEKWSNGPSNAVIFFAKSKAGESNFLAPKSKDFLRSFFWK